MIKKSIFKDGANKNLTHPKNKNGITLIALVITIIVLLILAGVTIATLTGENGILTRADDAKTETTKAEAREKIQIEAAASFDNTGKYNKDIAKANLKANLGTKEEDIKDKGNGTLIVKLDGYEFNIDNKGNVTFSITVAEAKEQGKIFSDNTVLTDTYGNSVTVPAGFKIASDSAIDVAGGVVIEDATYEGTKGSQFVWIPVGEVTGKVNGVEKTETITLGRYEFTKNADGTVTTSAYTGNYIEENSKDTTNLKKYGNAIAEDIETFKASTGVDKNGGYYIGRYEAGVTGYDSVSTSNGSKLTTWTGYTKNDGTNPQLVCKQGQQVWNYITQNKASELSKNMYSSDLTFTSDLINSYAWDTAIVFIQTFGEESNSSTYSKTEGKSSANTKGPQTTGTITLKATEKIDKQCNIFDMAGNTREWSTETTDIPGSPCADRGSFYGDSTSTSSRMYRNATTIASSTVAFRPLLYL